MYQDTSMPYYLDEVEVDAAGFVVFMSKRTIKEMGDGMD